MSLLAEFSGSGSVAKPTVVQVLNSLGLNRGGLTRAVMARTQCISSDSHLVFAVPSFQTDAEDVFVEMKDHGVIPPASSLRLFHAEVSNNGRIGSIEPSIVLRKSAEDGGLNKTVEPGKGVNLERYFCDGRFIGLIQRQNDGRVVSSIDYADQCPWMPIYKSVYDNQGRVRQRIFLGSDHKPRYQIFYNDNGGVYLASWLKADGTAYRVIKFDVDGARQFESMQGVLSEWFETVLDELGETIVLNDEPSTIFALAQKTSSATRVATIHAAHVKPISVEEVGPKAWLHSYLDVKANVDKFVFPTKVQAEDFKKTARIDERNVRTVRHPSPEPLDNPPERMPGLIVIVSRLAKDKQIDQAIRAVVRARKRVPNIQLKIFGTGDQRSALESLIQDLGARDYVELSGYTHNAAAEFAKAELSLLTSLHEGFGLVILESMVNGTPVVAYDAPFGPREIIKDGSNGYLVTINDIDGLAKKIAKALKPKHLKRMRSGAIDTTQEFSVGSWRSGWVELLRP